MFNLLGRLGHIERVLGRIIRGKKSNIMSKVPPKVEIPPLSYKKGEKKSYIIDVRAAFEFNPTVNVPTSRVARRPWVGRPWI